MVEKNVNSILNVKGPDGNTSGPFFYFCVYCKNVSEIITTDSDDYTKMVTLSLECGHKMVFPLNMLPLAKFKEYYFADKKEKGYMLQFPEVKPTTPKKKKDIEIKTFLDLEDFLVGNKDKLGYPIPSLRCPVCRISGMENVQVVVTEFTINNFFASPRYFTFQCDYGHTYEERGSQGFFLYSAKGDVPPAKRGNLVVGETKSTPASYEENDFPLIPEKKEEKKKRRKIEFEDD